MLHPAPNDPLPPPLFQPSSFFCITHGHSLATFSQHSGRLFAIWMACNLVGQVILHLLHSNPCSLLSRLPAAILWAQNSFIKYTSELISISRLLESSGKSVLKSALPAYHTIMLTQLCFPREAKLLELPAV